MLKSISFGLFFFASVCGYSQKTDDENVDAIIDAILVENFILENELLKLKPFKILNFSIDYNSKTYFSGRDIGIDQSNISPQITFASSKGFYTGLTGNYFSEFEPKWDATIGYVGFAKSFGKFKNYFYQVGYSRYFFTEEMDAIYNNTFDLGLGIKTNNASVGTKVIGSYIFGKEKAFQLVSSTFGTLKLLKSKNIKINLKPELNFVIGEQTIDIWSVVIIRNIPRIAYEQSKVFDLINTQLTIPLEMSFKKFQFDLSYVHNFPKSFEDEGKLPSLGFFNFSTSYYFSL